MFHQQQQQQRQQQQQQQQQQQPLFDEIPVSAEGFVFSDTWLYGVGNQSVERAEEMREIQTVRKRLEDLRPKWVPIDLMWLPYATHFWAESVVALADRCATLNINCDQLDALKASYLEDEKRSKPDTEVYVQQWRAGLTGLEGAIGRHRDLLRPLVGHFDERKDELENTVMKIDLDQLWRMFWVGRRPPGTEIDDVWTEFGWLAWAEIRGILLSAPLKSHVHEALRCWTAYEEKCCPCSVKAADALVALRSDAHLGGSGPFSSGISELTESALRTLLGRQDLSQVERESVISELEDRADRVSYLSELEKMASAVRVPSPSSDRERDERPTKRPRIVDYSSDEESVEGNCNNSSSNIPSAANGFSSGGPAGDDDFGAFDEAPLFLPDGAVSESNSSNSNPPAASESPSAERIEEDEGSQGDGRDGSSSSSSSSNSSAGGWVVHDEGCERCARAGRVCEGFPGQACDYCRTKARRRCELATHGRAARCLRNERVERKTREAHQRATAQVLRMPVAPVLEVSDIEELVAGMDESTIHFRMAALERRARVLFCAADQLRNLAEEMLAETSALGRVVRGEEEE
ncbi:hypothetical protein ACEPAF_1598 [Sanghuangporus sanghuang]